MFTITSAVCVAVMAYCVWANAVIAYQYFIVPSAWFKRFSRVFWQWWYRGGAKKVVNRGGLLLLGGAFFWLLWLLDAAGLIWY